MSDQSGWGADSFRVVRDPGGRPFPVHLVLLAAGGLAGAIGGSLLVLPGLFGLSLPAPEMLRLVGTVSLLVGVGLAVAGLGVVVFRPVRAGPAAAAAGFGSHRVMLTTTAFAVLLAALVGSILTPLVLVGSGRRDIQSVPGLLAAALGTDGVLLGVAYLRFLRPGVVSLDDFGLTRNRLAPKLFDSVWLAHLVSGFGAYVVGLLCTATLGLVLRQLGVQQTQLLDYRWVRQLPIESFLVVLLVGTIVAPLAEEVFFRGIVFRGYLLAKGPGPALAYGSVVFGLLHLNLQAFLPLAAFGAVLAWVYRATGSLAPAILAHSLNNSLAFLVLYVVPQSALP